MLKGSYQHGKAHGPWEWFDGNGILRCKGPYEHGQKHGPWEYFHDNGRLWAKGSYQHGVKKGKWIEMAQEKNKANEDLQQDLRILP